MDSVAYHLFSGQEAEVGGSLRSTSLHYGVRPFLSQQQSREAAPGPCRHPLRDVAAMGEETLHCVHQSSVLATAHASASVSSPDCGFHPGPGAQAGKLCHCGGSSRRIPEPA